MDIITFLIVIAIIVVLLVLLRIHCAGGVNRCKRDLTGKIIIVTGGTNGMGKIVVEQLANTGCKIVSLSRNNTMANEVIKKLKEIYKDIDIEHIQCDLGSLDSVKKCAETIIEKYDHVDILINNAGVMRVPPSSTENGFEKHLGVNYIGHFLLTQKLLPLMEKCHGRVINLSSVASTMWKRKEFYFHLDEGKDLKPMGWYCQSKLAMAIMSKQLAKRNDKIEAVSLHPGCVNTSLWQFFPPWFKYGLYLPLQIIFKTPLEGTQTCLHLIHSETVQNGEYYADCKVADKYNKTLDDEELCDKFWNDTMDALKTYL